MNAWSGGNGTHHFVSSGSLSGVIKRDLLILSSDRTLFLTGCAQMVGRSDEKQGIHHLPPIRFHPFWHCQTRNLADYIAGVDNCLHRYFLDALPAAFGLARACTSALLHLC